MITLGETGRLLIWSLIGSLHVSKQQEVEEFQRNRKLVDLVSDWFTACL